jgi:uncharacterized protein involved in exopolysaccharide biosynthesis
MHEVSLLDYYLVLKNRVKFIGAIIFICTVLGIIVSYILPSTYRAIAVLMPTESSSLSAGLGSTIVGQLMGQEANTRASQKLIAFLESRQLLERLKMRFKNDPKVYPHLSQDNIFYADEETIKGTIQVGVTFGDAQSAADVTNSLVEELQKMMQETTLKAAKQKTTYMAEQLASMEAQYLEMSKALSQFYEKNSVSPIASKINVHVYNLNDLGPAGLNSVENAASKFSVQNVPQQSYFEYLSLQKQILTQIVNMLHTQFEMSKINEANNATYFRVIDSAIPPMHKYGPRRTIIVLGSFMGSTVISVIIAFLLEYVASIKRSSSLPN